MRRAYRADWPAVDTVQHGREGEGGLHGWIERQDPTVWALAAMVLVWTVVFYRLAALRHDRFGTFGFDLGIYDQGTWLTAHFRNPFVTVRGMNFFGHHMNLAQALFAPAYWLGGGPKTLLFAQVASQGAAAVGVYVLARDRIGMKWIAVALAGALLLNPTFQWLVWEFFHPDALGIAPLIFTYWAGRRRAWGWFAFLAVLTVACREDFALAVAVVGLLVAGRGDQRVGLLTAGLSAGWFVVVTRVFQPMLLGGLHPMTYGMFGPLGDDPLEIAKNVLTKPRDTWHRITAPDRLDYLTQILVPFAFLPLLAPQVFAIALPTLLVNVLTEYPYTRDYKFHYSAVIVAAAMLATVELIASARHRPGLVRFLTGAVVAVSLAASVAWGCSPVSVKYRTGVWPLEMSEKQGAREHAVGMIPDGASVSAAYTFVPHLAHREQVYEYPVPWENINWGVEGENLDDPATVDWLAIDKGLLDIESTKLLDRLLEREFRVAFDQNDILVARRVHPPS
jgi:uncharacterized membrane protein